MLLTPSALEHIPVVLLKPDVKNQYLQEKYEERESRYKNDRFAKVYDLDINPENSGTWTTLTSGRKIWRVGIESAGAYSVNVIFNRFHLAPGVKVFLYNIKQDFVLGAYTRKNNKASGVFAVTPVPGERLYVEMQLDKGMEDYGDLTIRQAGHDYKDIYGISRKKDSWFENSDTCNVDINCIDDPGMQRVKYSVIRIIYAGKERCTGTLLNTTKNSGTPYLLTANHCLGIEYYANTALFYFDYESPYCNGPDGFAGKSISGGDIVATSANVDFSLVKLSEHPPYYYKPYFAGWDATTRSPENSYSIHHPWGDVKKVTIDDDPATTGNFGDGLDESSHWQIYKWDLGTTEKGSSGAALFNQEDKVIGNLTGGDASCVYPYYDYFQKFSRCWADYDEPGQQLKHWLDPLGKDVEQWGGYDPYADYFSSLDTLGNISDEDETGIISPQGYWGYLSGHNEAGISVFAEKFVNNGIIYLREAGLHVYRSFAGSDNSFIMLKIWEGEPAGGDPVYEQAISYDYLKENLTYYVELDSAIELSGDFYAGYGINYFVQDTFALYMANERVSGQLNTAWIKEDDQWVSLEDASIGGVCTSFDISVIGSSSVPSGLEPDEMGLPRSQLIIYPNPASSELTIDLPDEYIDAVIIELYSVNGLLVKNKMILHNNLIHFDVNGLQTGIYILKITHKRDVITRKVSLIQ